MKFPIIIKGLNEIIDKYDIFILDQWGVMHDGRIGFDYAVNCVNELVKQKKKLIIISNSSKRKDLTINRLPSLGYDPNDFDEVMTSGEMIWQSLKKSNYDFTKKLKKNCYYLYDETKNEGAEYISELKKFNFIKDIKDADFILATTINDKMKTLDYMPILELALKKNIPLICANPDFETLENDSLTICMGTIAELYKSLGGNIFILGKPKKDIYIESTKQMKELDKSKILAVGDSIYHDIQGANLFGIDSVLITSGIHNSIFKDDHSKWNTELNNFKNSDILPTYMCSNFKY